jgi:hypothetical protein
MQVVAGDEVSFWMTVGGLVVGSGRNQAQELGSPAVGGTSAWR